MEMNGLTLMEPETETKAINIMLVDDHKIIRDGIKAFLKEEQQINIIGEANNGKELLEFLELQQPDVVLLDVNMPEMDGYETTLAIRERFPEVKVLILSMLDHEKYVTKLMDAGAQGYVLKNSGKDELLNGIRLVNAGHKFISTDLALIFLNKLQQGVIQNSVSAPSERKATELSAREIEVLKLIAEGLTNAEIADKLYTSKRTIESHRQNIIEKAQVKNTAALIKYALVNGIIS